MHARFNRGSKCRGHRRVADPRTPRSSYEVNEILAPRLDHHRDRLPLLPVKLALVVVLHAGGIHGLLPAECEINVLLRRPTPQPGRDLSACRSVDMS